MVNTRYIANTLGNGPIAIEIWLDYICPFSKKQFETIYKTIAPTVEKKYPNKFTFVFQHQLQPWHGQGTYLHEAAVAVGQIAPSKFWEFSSKLFTESERFYDSNAVDVSRKQIINELSEIAEHVGVDKAKFLDSVTVDVDADFKNSGTKVTDDVKYFVKLGRQTGIHVSPTVVINGIIDPSVSSSWKEDQWLERLQDVLSSVENQI